MSMSDRAIRFARTGGERTHTPLNSRETELEEVAIALCLLLHILSYYRTAAFGVIDDELAILARTAIQIRDGRGGNAVPRRTCCAGLGSSPRPS